MRIALVVILGLLLAPPALAQDEVVERKTADQPDVTKDFQVHPLYVLPRDGYDRRLDKLGIIERSLGLANKWLAKNTGGSKLRFDRRIDGRIDVTFLRLDRDAATLKAFSSRIRDEIEKDINAAGFNHPRKLYLVYYEGPNRRTCASGAWPPKFPGNAAVLFLLTTFKKATDCTRYWFTFEEAHYWERSAVHELLHTLGFVARCNQAGTKGSHVMDDDKDLLYGKSRKRGFRHLDPDNNQYFRHGIKNCPDFANSAFLEPLPKNAEPPPGWVEDPTCRYLGYGKRKCGK